MAFGMHELFPIFRIAAALGVAAAVFFAFRLYRETDKGWYWGALVLSAFFMALSKWLFILIPLIRNPGVLGILCDAGEILASVLFAVSCYGMYRTMHVIRKRVE